MTKYNYIKDDGVLEKLDIDLAPTNIQHRVDPRWQSCSFQMPSQEELLETLRSYRQENTRQLQETGLF